MPRTLVLGNGRLQVNLDADYDLRDLYYPRVGQENHIAGGRCRTGVWCAGEFAWLSDKVWERELRYLEDSLVTRVRMFHPVWRLELLFNDAVDMDQPLYLRRVTVTNQSGLRLEVRLFFHYDLRIYGNEVGDTLLYDPKASALVAYKGRRYFLANVMDANGPGVKTWAIGLKEVHGLEGTWRDAEDGRLEENAIAQGSVDGTVGLPLGGLAPGQTVVGYHWLVVGETKADIESLDAQVRERGPGSYIDRTRDWWRAWGSKEELEFADLDKESARQYRRSLLTVRTHVDDGGAFIASTDWDIASWARDTYAYCWPRDGALMAMGLDQAGYGDLSRRFFRFCLSVLNPFDGYFLQKFTPGGEQASSWHPWLGPRKQPQLPIQEDETGLVLHALWKHYERYRDIEFVKPLYRPMVRGAADFLAAYRDRKTGLPLPSYDLWEERRGVHAFTIGAVWAGLQAAANFARTFNQQDLAEQYRAAADEVRAAALTHLWDKERGHFSRSLMPRDDGSYERDPTLDSSILGLTLFGMLDPQHPTVRFTVQALHSRLWCKTPIGGMARYEGDYYHRRSHDLEKLPGNPWFLCTLWLAQYYIMAAESRIDLQRPREMLRWCERHALPSGLMAEQLDPFSGEPLSVSPLAWSHAEYVKTVRAYVAAYDQLVGAPQPDGAPRG